MDLMEKKDSQNGPDQAAAQTSPSPQPELSKTPSKHGNNNGITSSTVPVSHVEGNIGSTTTGLVSSNLPDSGEDNIMDPASLLLLHQNSKPMHHSKSLSIDTSKANDSVLPSPLHPSANHKISSIPQSVNSPKQHPNFMSAKTISPVMEVQDLSPVKTRPSLTLSNIIVRKKQSIAFFIDLISPERVELKGTKYNVDPLDGTTSPYSPRSPTVKPEVKSATTEKGGIVEEIENGSSPMKGMPPPMQPPTLVSDLQKLTLQDSQQQAQIKVIDASKPSQSITFPLIKKNTKRAPARQLQANLEGRLNTASAKRHQLIQERRQKLASNAHTIKIRMLVHDSRKRLELLRMQAKQEYNHTNAQLNRHVWLRQVKERSGGHVEHVKRVMMIQKMKKFVELRKTLSENFIDLIKLHEELDADEEREIRMELEGNGKGNDDERRRRSEILESLGLSVSIANEKEDEYETSDPQQTDAWPMPDSPLSKKPTTSPTQINAKQFIKDFSSDYIFATSPKSKSESLADQIRRTKSLPDLVLRDASYDSTIQELLSLLPPVTRFTLRELEMDEILSNMQLRHDIVFDPDLQFKASDADDEDAKEKNNAYWEELEQEVGEGHMYRICLLLAEVRAIMVELVPNGMEIKDEIFNHIDTNLISQQIEHGVMNPTVLIDYIAGIMKTNCAPIRDKLVDQMVVECQQGQIVKCLQTCFEILELMKLDYANHQLSRLRPYIIEHSVNYEWKYFRNQYEARLVGLEQTIDWLKRNWTAYKEQSTSSPNPAYDLYPEAFIEIVSQAARFGDSDILPETLSMDLTRLISFYNGWQDITILSTILVVFKQAAGPKCLQDNMDEAKTALWILLNDADSTMSHISIQMASMAGKIRKHTFTAQETNDLNTMTEKMLAPGSKLYELMQKRVGIHLEAGVGGQKMDVALLAKHGLQSVQKEIEELIAKMVPVAELNRAVFGKLYAALLDDIKEGKEHESPTAKMVIFK